MNDKFLKPYDPVSTEADIYKIWDKSGFFNPDNLPEKYKDSKPFSIVLPPPNVTGTLHMGHAAMLAIEDIMIRYKRMKSFKTLWIPGTDHAAIATQSKVEKEISKKEGKSRHDLGREELLKRVEEFANESHDTIVNQIKRMGCSLDWSREAFTLDEKRNLAVRTAFKTMYDMGLIYRGYRIVNWDPKGQTTISDDEIVYEERPTKLYTFKYSKDIPISISTTRPETKLGDTAIAVHPDDKRYKKYIGLEYDAIFAGENIHIKVIADEGVDPDFGTGALGVTPAHSSIDWEMAERHNLLLKQVIDEYARMTVGGDNIKGKKIVEAREEIVKWLKENNLLEKEEDIKHNISLAERTGGIIEPLPKLQWFIAVNKKFKKGDKEMTLKEMMKEVVGNGSIKIIPERYERVYYNWIENLHDWCISRQIWYGHRIPVWYRDKEIYIGTEAPKDDIKGNTWVQDEDTLDTWFSSGLWTFSTLGWPEKTEDLKVFHPTDVLETGYDILFFWIARMILMTGCILDTIPFKTVYLHGLVRTSKGEKMSKSKPETNIDPLDMINKYGADATRLSLIIGTGPGNDIKLSEDKIKGYKNFANKLWNIARFIFENTKGDSIIDNFKDYSDIDNKLKDEIHTLIIEITKEMDEYKFYIVGEKLYHYIWHEFADKILEESKKILKEGNEKEKLSRKQFLLHTLESILKVLHPFMPYITEEIWKDIPRKDKDLLMIENWPK